MTKVGLIFNDAPGALPAQYVVPPTLDLQISSIVARFNGAAASGAFLPCLAIYSQDGHLVGRFHPNVEVSAGDTATVTYAPFLRTVTTTAGGCTVLTRDFDTKDGEDFGAGYLWNGGAGDATFVVDGSSPTGEAVAFSGTYADFATYLASVTGDAYVIEVTNMSPPAPWDASGGFTYFRWTANILVRGTDAATTYKLSVGHGANVTPPETYISKGGDSVPFVYDDAWHRETTEGYFNDDVVTRSFTGTSYVNVPVQGGNIIASGGYPGGTAYLFLYGWKTAGAGTLRIARVTFSWIATDF